jgi:hypothetical protein
MDNDYYLNRAVVRDKNTFHSLDGYYDLLPDRERNQGLKPLKLFIFGLAICAIITVFI